MRKVDMRDIPEQAIAIVMPAIDELLKRAKRNHLHIVIMNPQLKPWESDFETAIWHEHSVRDDKDWDHDFRAFAISKANQDWREGQHNLITQTLAPALLRKGDTFFTGSFNYYGVIVACSGIEPEFDMLISGWIAMAIQQLTKHYIERHRQAYPKENFML